MQPELSLRVSAFAGVLLLVAFGEMLAPRRHLQDNKGRRWFVNLSLIIIDTAAVRLLFPILPVAVAAVAEVRGWGLFNVLHLSYWTRTVLGLLLLDLIIYFQHFLFHHSQILWRLHRMHHTDLDLDVTSGVRIHPLEIVISMMIKLFAVFLSGVPAHTVLFFEVILNSCSLFIHGNIRIPESFDRLLRIVLVTPDMHLVHHSTIRQETNSNFGFNVPWWDHIFGTYRPRPEKGHLEMTIGLEEYRDPRTLTLPRLLIQPFTST